MPESEPYLELEAEQGGGCACCRPSSCGEGLLCFGRAALTQAKEVNRLVEVLKQAGATDADIRLRGAFSLSFETPCFFAGFSALV
ncbi:hypothetical protein COW36_01095 [bacterium (Candidatus Blackallbacteria) CG17_big_fil_post_rev_8_21_14_2_50_48_46]|uniref:Uncharacterized protein n=1 Tax=bacterium (Candidatus Blackallbacteria) CG17_big_fil_post_rev_8_21_14_2_50_48_46 TaxID=2014261 RepID=A0A2M7GBB1_9BACT|nr:MAG: hypothetical protein COW64_10080 [bacterium (Candidatus Blackallbacteria) CG18_big_fil_WC_8_21_14_2_50_49_26]PIW19464.1 MAG: hypothetical protein COW36_01095 [bacterium (Candidatus Blackallbacteria) CG17_big_fil_post_rev_8_21_14_2_50_48_46]PIW48932.1 MAG: hypothetical protein COW20_07360 [bacterium (Candidatus Blackallbacteria) CG13_big_fil_rev_8_21_14_2_50_49_14]